MDQSVNERSKESKNYWKRFKTGPSTIRRPHFNEVKGVFLFTESSNCNMDLIWKYVCEATENGYLGYYCGFSDEGNRIAVHTADPWEFDEMDRIRSNLELMGIDDIDLITVPTLNKLHSDCEGCGDRHDQMQISAKLFEVFAYVCFKGEIVSKQMFEENPGLYIG